MLGTREWDGTRAGQRWEDGGVGSVFVVETASGWGGRRAEAPVSEKSPVPQEPLAPDRFPIDTFAREWFTSSELVSEGLVS